MIECNRANKPKEKEALMKVPWLKPGVWGIIIGSVGTMIGGFGWMGWTLGSTAERMAVDRANAAIVAALTPACVASFGKQPDATKKLAEFVDAGAWAQKELVEKGGWATPPGSTEPNSGLASACAEQLAKTATKGKT